MTTDLATCSHDAAVPRSRAAAGMQLLSSVLVGGAVAGALDLAFAMTMWGARGVPVKTIPLSIASGLFGPDAFKMGTPGVVAGVGLHFGMTISMAAAYAIAAGRWPSLARHPVRAGLAYGALVYGVMTVVVVPLSRAPLKAPPTAVALADLGAHLLLVGLPIALIVGRAMRRG
jgi:hypothetical protein